CGGDPRHEPDGARRRLQKRARMETRAPQMPILRLVRARLPLPAVTAAGSGGTVLIGRSAKSLLEPRVVADGGEVVVPRRLLAKPRERIDRPAEVVERLVAGLARQGREARVVVVEARMVRHVLAAAADGRERIRI